MARVDEGEEQVAARRTPQGHPPVIPETILPLPLLDLNRRQKKTYTKLCSQWSQTRRHAPPRQTCKHPDGGDAYQPVLFHFVPGAFHLDILPGRKSCAGPKTY